MTMAAWIAFVAFVVAVVAFDLGGPHRTPRLERGVDRAVRGLPRGPDLAARARGRAGMAHRLAHREGALRRQSLRLPGDLPLVRGAARAAAPRADVGRAGGAPDAARVHRRG